MRRFLCILVLAAMLFNINTYAVNVAPDVAAPISVIVDGKPVSFDVTPRLIDGVVMVPFRAIGEAIGAKAAWEDGKREVWMYQGTQYVGMKVGEKLMRLGKMGGPEIHIDLPATVTIIDDRALVPIRAVSEGLRCSVSWDKNTSTVSVTTNYRPAPTVSNTTDLLSQIDEQIEAMNTKFTIDTVDLSESALYLDLPSYFLNVNLATTKHWVYWANGVKNIMIEYTVEYSMYASVSRALKNNSTSGLNERQIEIYNRVRDVIAWGIGEGITTYEKVKYIHDWLIKHVEYDYSPSPSTEAHTPYGALINGKAVCNGYSDSLKLFMDAMGIECEIVYGEVRQGDKWQKHAWNRVNIGGDYYLIDVTWDEPEQGFPDYISYDYFNVNDDIMNRDHRPYNTVKKSTAMYYNYYKLNQLTVTMQSDADILLTRGILQPDKPIYMQGQGFDLSRINYYAISNFMITHTVKTYHNKALNTMVLFFENK
ncbi:MAG: hypothetical protein LBL96_07115 [Clostridiales bacterium]|nr:hypothetical protein [Clostridiales bacterium]